MRIAIFGAGSMGTILGALLTKGGCSVELIDTYHAHVDALNANGAKITGTAYMTVPVRAKVPEEMEGIYDLVFLMTKQTANAAALRQLLPHLGESSTVCTLQNGVPELSVAEMIGRERTVGGIMMWSAAFEGPGISSLCSELGNDSYPFFEVGEMDGSVTDRIRMVAQVLSHMGRTMITDNLMGARWFKVMINSTISGMSAALGITFYKALHDEKIKPYSFLVARECGRVCKAAGYRMPDFQGKDPADICDFRDEAGMKECERMLTTIIPPENKTGIASMLQDLMKGKTETEIGMINGFVTEQGGKAGVDTPFNNAVVSIVRGIEQKEALIARKTSACSRNPLFKHPV